MSPLYELLKRWSHAVLPRSVLGRLLKRHYLRTVVSFNAEEEPDLPYALRFVSEGDTVVDVGASIGIYTTRLAERVGRRGRVVSIEPRAETFEYLSYVVDRLRLQNVELHNIGISDKAGFARMVVPQDPHGVPMHYQAYLTDISVAAHTERPVRLKTLDEVLAGHQQVGFIKCDTEGHELECILGAANTIERCAPAWLMEVAGDPDQTESRAAAVLEVMGRAGYEAWYAGPRGLERRTPGVRSVNYFFLTERHMG